ncbi:MAG TPA: hypothetical protein VK335_01585 [Bryobacteraceae bacterium]|nr:hypothetical protein [Bryobacteraceae bacterium]
MKSVRLLLTAALLPLICAAEVKCPWLNAATAAGVLGGAVTANVTQGTCEFVRRDDSSKSALRIEVDTLATPREFASRAAQCGSGAEALKAIGNEAVACTHSGKQGQIAEQVVGRVRNQAFLVRVSTDDRGATPAGLREKARKVAEQVAGFLF